MTNYDVKEQETYFRKAWSNAMELCVYLCKLYGLTEHNIICHSEGYARGIASQHSDVMHWFPLHSENMNTFRVAVKAKLIKEDDNMTQDELNEMIDNWQNHNNPLYARLDDVPDYWREEAVALAASGIITGDGINSFGLRRETLKALILCKRYMDLLRK